MTPRSYSLAVVFLSAGRLGGAARWIVVGTCGDVEIFTRTCRLVMMGGISWILCRSSNVRRETLPAHLGISAKK